MTRWNPFSRKSDSIQSLIAVFDYQSNSYPCDKSKAADAAASELAQRGTAAVTPLVAQLGHENYHVGMHSVAALVQIGVPAIPALLEAMAVGGIEARKNAICCLGRIRASPAVEKLIVALTDSDLDVRNEAARALGEIGDASATEPLLAALEDRGRYWAFYVIEALGKLGDPRAVEPIIANRYGELSPACEALGRIGDARAVDTLIQVLQDREILEEAKRAGGQAAIALGEIGDARASEPLRAALNSEDDGLCTCAATALLKLGDPQGLRRIVELLAEVSTINRDPQQVWREAVLAFGQRNRDAYVAYFGEFLKPSSTAGERRCAAEFLLRVDEAPPTQLVRTILLDWLEFAGSERDQADDGVRLLADAAGMDTALLRLAMTALGYTIEVKSGSSSGGNFGWTSLESYNGGMSAIEALCLRKDVWSSCILFRVARKKDVSVTMTTCAPSTYEVPLSFENERETARQELARRGIRDTDPLSQL